MELYFGGGAIDAVTNDSMRQCTAQVCNATERLWFGAGRPAWSGAARAWRGVAWRGVVVAADKKLSQGRASRIHSPMIPTMMLMPVMAPAVRIDRGVDCC